MAITKLENTVCKRHKVSVAIERYKILIDRNKRNTLKKMALGTGALGAGVVTSGAAFASPTASVPAELAINHLELGSIEVTTRVSAISNDLEVAMTNVGKQRVNITHLTPRTMRVARGEFDFSALLSNGPLRLEPNQSVAVALKRMPVKIAVPAQSLHGTLKQTMSVITDNNAFASVSVDGAVV